jgi:hypothetical protein
MADFVSQGVDMTRIKKVYIGFGDRESPVCSGGSGVVYFDDIRLYPARCRVEMSTLKADLNNDCITNLYDLDILVDMWVEDQR